MKIWLRYGGNSCWWTPLNTVCREGFSCWLGAHIVLQAPVSSGNCSASFLVVVSWLLGVSSRRHCWSVPSSGHQEALQSSGALPALVHYSVNLTYFSFSEFCLLSSGKLLGCLGGLSLNCHLKTFPRLWAVVIVLAASCLTSSWDHCSCLSNVWKPLLGIVCVFSRSGHENLRNVYCILSHQSMLNYQQISESTCYISASIETSEYTNSCTVFFPDNEREP